VTIGEILWVAFTVITVIGVAFGVAYGITWYFEKIRG